MRGALCIAIVLFGCGSGSTSNDANDADTGRDATAGGDVAADAGRDAATAPDAPGADGAAADGAAADSAISCGTMTCTGDDLCVTVSTCGGAPQCTELPDGGSCSAGMIATTCPTGRPGCTFACPPPTSSCRPRPAACGATISCSCITAATCGGPSCASASGRSVFCAAQ